MRILSALLLLAALLVMQLLHGGWWEPAFLVPSGGFLIVCAIIAGILVFWTKDTLPVLQGGVVTAVFAYFWWRCWIAPDHLAARADQVLTVECLLVFLLTGGVLTGGRERIVIIAGLIGFAALQGIVGFSQAFDVRLPVDLPWFSLEVRGLYDGKFGQRAHGLYANPNHFAWLMNFSALFCLALAVWGRFAMGLRILLFYLAALFVAAMVFAASRGGLLSFAVGGATFLFMSLIGIASGLRRNRSGAFAGLIGGAVVLYVVGAFVFSSSWLARGRADSDFLLLDIRTHFNQFAFRMFQSEPFLGIGPGNFEAQARLYRSGFSAADAIHAHNDWIQVAAEYGIIGFFAALLGFGVVLVAAIQGTLRTIEQGGVERSVGLGNSVALGLGACATLVAFAVHSLVDFNLHIPANALLAALTLGVAANCRRGDLYVARFCVASRVGVAAGLVACLIFLSLYFKVHARADYEGLLAKNFFFSGDNRSAIEASKRALAARPLSPDVLRIESLALWSLPEAQIYTESQPVMVIDDDEPTILERDKLREIGRNITIEAAELLMEAVEMHPRSRQLNLLAGQACETAGQGVLAEKFLREGIRLEPALAYPYEVLGNFYYRNDRYKDAVETLSVASQLPGGEESRLLLEEILEESAKTDVERE